jgi:hypothetical protein
MTSGDGGCDCRVADVAKSKAELRTVRADRIRSIRKYNIIIY